MRDWQPGDCALAQFAVHLDGGLADGLAECVVQLLVDCLVRTDAFVKHGDQDTVGQAGLAFTAAGQALWGRITQFFAGSILGALILGRKRDRCRHCNKPLTDQEGILVDENDNYECADNPNGDHHQLKRR